MAVYSRCAGRQRNTHLIRRHARTSLARPARRRRSPGETGPATHRSIQHMIHIPAGTISRFYSHRIIPLMPARRHYGSGPMLKIRRRPIRIISWPCARGTRRLFTSPWINLCHPEIFSANWKCAVCMTSPRTCGREQPPQGVAVLALLGFAAFVGGGEDEFLRQAGPYQQ